MNTSQLQVAIQDLSKKYVADLQDYESDFKISLGNFLTSVVKKCLVIETRDSKLCVNRTILMLKQLKQNGQNQEVLDKYVNAKNQTFFNWKMFIDVVGPIGDLPRLTNLLVCEFSEPVKVKKADLNILNKIIASLRISISKKVIFITSQKGSLDGYLKNLDMQAFLKINEFENKISSMIYGNEIEALFQQTSRGHVNDVMELIKSGVNVNVTSGLDESTALHVAAKEGYKEVVLILLRNGALNLLNKNKNSPLHQAAKNGFEDVVIVLLENDVDVNTKGGFGRTALHEAVLNNHIDVVKTLIKYNANINAQDENGSTALHIISDKQNIEIVKFLLNNGASILPDYSKDTPLQIAARNGHKNLLLILLEHGVDVNIKGGSGLTALHEGVGNSHRDIVKTILKYGVDINMPTENGFSPLHLSVYQNDIEIVKILLDQGADINAKDMAGFTPLHDASHNGRIETVKLLTKRGANIDARNKNGKTAIDLAVENRNDNIVSLLRTKNS